MTSQVPWAPTFDFASDPNPQDKVNAVALQGQLSALGASLADLYIALAVSIRDDDTLEDELVRIRNLHPELATYLDARLTGTVLTNALDYKYPVQAASTANVSSLLGAQTIDGVALTTGKRVLLKNQTLPAQNGLWVVREIGDPSPNASGLWTRATDLPAAAASGSGWAVIVREGTLNGSTAWVVVAGGTASEQPVVGTDELPFLPVFAPFPLPVSRGGTGATTAGAARTSLGVPGKATSQITGDASTVTFVVTHSLATAAVLVAVQQHADGEEVSVTVTKTASNVTLVFASAPANGVVYDVIIVG